MKDPEAERRRAEHREQLRKQILAQYVIVDEGTAWNRLGAPGDNAAEVLAERARQGEVLRLIADGEPVYPAFQFDEERGCVLPAVQQILRVRPASYSEYQLLAWLTRPHLNFDGRPLDALGEQPDAVLKAFLLEIEPITHG